MCVVRACVCDDSNWRGWCVPCGAVACDVCGAAGRCLVLRGPHPPRATCTPPPHSQTGMSTSSVEGCRTSTSMLTHTHDTHTLAHTHSQPAHTHSRTRTRTHSYFHTHTAFHPRTRTPPHPPAHT